MYNTLKIILSGALLMLPLVSSAQSEISSGTRIEPIPAIIKNHKNKALFTKVNNNTAEMKSLFNGENFDGWYTYTPKYGINKDEAEEFNIVDGIIHLAGEPMGYFCTNDSYKNYYLRVVFRWGEKKYFPRLDNARDSGILYHFPIGVQDKLWPTSIECQIQENDCGDYWCVGGSNADSPNTSKMEGTQKRIFKTENFENPNPEWNTIEVICYDDKSEHYVNGHLINHAYNLSTTEGKILFQLEGAEIYYKTIELLPLK